MSLIHKFARLFVAKCFSRGYADRMQIFSTYFIDEDFVDACQHVLGLRTQGLKGKHKTSVPLFLFLFDGHGDIIIALRKTIFFLYL
jgi:hypothetical protein